MKFKNFVLVVALGICLNFALNTNIVKAIAPDEINALIKQLQAQIADLQKQLAAQKNQSKIWCYDFKANLKYGDKGAEIENLKIALNKENFYKKESTANLFDEYVASAVVGFQEKYKKDILEPRELKYGTGYVGQATIKKLNEIYSCKENESYIENSTKKTDGIIFEDNFDSYEVSSDTNTPWQNGWNIKYNGYGTKYQKIVSEESVSASNSLKLEGQTNWAASVDYLLPETPNQITFEVDVKTTRPDNETDGWANAYVTLIDPNVGWGRGYGMVVFEANKLINEKISYNLNQWYHVKVKVDMLKRVADIWIDGVHIETSDIPKEGFYKGIRLDSDNSGHTRSWFDNVKVYSSETANKLTCEYNPHNNGGPWLFQNEGYWIDMDITTPAEKISKTPQAYSGIENSLTVSPGQKVTIKAIIDFEGYTACPGCVMYQRIFPSWDTTKVLGDFGGMSYRKKDITFTAPTEPGEYKLHFNWRADYVPPPQYCDSNMVETTLIVE
ncbi:MAG: hypothetical protein ABH919_03680 [bacterium]